MPEQGGLMSRGQVVATVVLFVAVLAGGWWASTSGGEGPVEAPAAAPAEPEPDPGRAEEIADRDDRIDAGVGCEEFINQRSGDSVEHGDWRDYFIVDRGEDVWFVRGAFEDGTGWRCEIRLVEDGWELIDLVVRR